MSKLRFHISMSLDGYVAGPNQGPDAPLGEGAEVVLHDWFTRTRMFKSMFGEEDEGETGLDNDRAEAWSEDFGATIMGRNMFGPIRGEWGDEEWKGWWGDEPPYHSPVFVLTHHAHAPIEMEGGTTFHFVTEGPEAALERAREVAGSRDINIGGGASTAQQYLRLGLVDEMEIHVVPAILGAGERLLENLDGPPSYLKPLEVLSSPRAAHFHFVCARGEITREDFLERRAVLGGRAAGTADDEPQ
jgi:dihydrofolate reductase